MELNSFSGLKKSCLSRLLNNWKTGRGFSEDFQVPALFEPRDKKELRFSIPHVST